MTLVEALEDAENRVRAARAQVVEAAHDEGVSPTFDTELQPLLTKLMNVADGLQTLRRRRSKGAT